MTGPTRAELLAENAELRARAARWEMATLALLSRGLDGDTAARVRDRIRHLAGVR